MADKVSMATLALAKEWLVKEDTLLFESDLIFEDSVLECLIEDPRETLALVDKYESWMDGTWHLGLLVNKLLARGGPLVFH